MTDCEFWLGIIRILLLFLLSKCTIKSCSVVLAGLCLPLQSAASALHQPAGKRNQQTPEGTGVITPTTVSIRAGQPLHSCIYVLIYILLRF